jgi:hypothetical protein
MQIHQVEVFDELRREIDPARGIVARREQVIRKGGATRIAHEGVTYEIDPDGSFDVPEEVAAVLVGKPGWYEGPNPFPAEVEAQPKPRSRAKATA